MNQFPLLFALLAACAHTSEVKTPAAETGLSYPEAPRGDVVDSYHGTDVADPYRWLEDPDTPESRTWIDAQNTLTQSWLGEVPKRGAIQKRLEKIWDYERFGHPVKRGTHYFYTHNDGLQDQAVLLVTENLEEDGRVLLDPNTFSEDGTVSLAGWSPSRNGAWLAYGVSDGGSDWKTWRVLNVETGEVLEDRLEWMKWGGVSWTLDDAGFYYGRYPQPEDGAALQAANYHQKLYHHRLHTSGSEDRLVLETPEEPEWSFWAPVTEDGSTLVVHVFKDTGPRNLLYTLDLTDPEATLQKHVTEFESSWILLGKVGDRLWLQTNESAPKERVVTLDLTDPKAPVVEVIPEGAHALVSVSMVGERLVTTALVDVVSQVNVYGLDGGHLREVELSGPLRASGFGGRIADPETFYTTVGYTEPGTTWRVNVQTGETSMFRRTDVDFEAGAYVTEQLFYESKDGTRIPLFVTHAKDIPLDGSHPTLLYGYGGFNISIQPHFSPAVAVWLEMGGIYAVANIRGGGEYGEAWHEAGIHKNKQNVFDDFIAAGEFLVESGWTRPDKLAIQGRSNGGLLVGATLLQRPDLFGAALPAVGVLDMLRYHEFTIGHAWAADYGTRDDPEMFSALLAYSPVHNTHPGTQYPATMILTGDHDDRVVPAHSFKFAAALQHAQGGDAPVLARIETRAGHGSGKSTTMRIEEVTDEWSFLVRALEMDLGEFGTSAD